MHGGDGLLWLLLLFPSPTTQLRLAAQPTLAEALDILQEKEADFQIPTALQAESKLMYGNWDMASPPYL